MSEHTAAAARTRQVVQELVDVGPQQVAVRRLDPAPAPGEGPEPVVLVHGLGQSSTDWLRMLPALDGRLEPYALDLPGHGASPPAVHGDYSPSSFATSVIGLIERQGIGPVHLAGNSLGGLVALMVAARRPDLVRTLTLVSPALPARVPTPAGLRLMLLAAPQVGERLVALGARRTPEQRARDLLAVIVAAPHEVPEEDVAALAEELRAQAELPHAGPAFLASLRGLVRVHLRRYGRTWALARYVSAPTLVLYGGRDKLVSARAARRARSLFRSARVEVDPAGGHIPQREHPLLVAEALVRHAREGSSPQVDTRQGNSGGQKTGSA